MTYARLKPFLQLSEEQALERVEIHNDFQRGGGVVDYEIETVQVEEEQGQKVSRDLLSVTVPPDVDPGLVHYNNDSGDVKFEFDKVFDTDTRQEDVFEEVVAPKVQDVLSGVNCTVFAYGQTGSGKTFTVSGGDSFDERGLIPRTIALVFTELKERLKLKEFTYKCQISFTEVYNEVIYDLLDQDQRAIPLDKRSPVQVLESPNGLVLRNLNVYEISSEEDALGLFFMGNATRLNDATSMNQASSRSHAIFTIIIETEGMPVPGNQESFENDLIVDGKINLVDLAGSERMYKMKNNKEQLKEAKSINLSLHYLEQVIISLRSDTTRGDKHKGDDDKHIPYRNSVLTNVLRDSLGGNCQSCFILLLSTDRLHFEESISTCRFGQRCGEVKVAIEASVQVSLADQLKEQTRRVRLLEAELSSEKTHSEEALDELRAQVERCQEVLHSQAQELELQRGLRESAERGQGQREQEPAGNEAGRSDAEVATGTVEGLFVDATRSINIIKTAGDSMLGSLGDGDKAICKDLEARGLKKVVDAALGARKAVLVETVRKLAECAQALFIEREMLLHEKQKISSAANSSGSPAAGARAGAGGGAGSAGVQAEDWLQLLQRGHYFLKFDRMSRKSIRFVCVTADLKSLYWTKISGSNTPTLVSLDDFDRATIDGQDDSSSSSALTASKKGKDKEVTLTLVGRQGNRSRRLVVLNTQNEDQSQDVGRFWCDALNILLDTTNLTGRDAREKAKRRVASPPPSLAVRLTPLKSPVPGMTGGAAFHSPQPGGNASEMDDDDDL